MRKIRETDGCIKCGDANRGAIGFTALDKDGKKIIVKICFSCLAKQAEEEMLGHRKLHGGRKNENQEGN